jgi:sulfatase modifying factor 1
MTWIPGGTFTMGADDFYPEELPVRSVDVAGFWIDTCPVTVAEFRAFVEDAGYTTLAERAPDVPGSAVFSPTDGPVPLTSLVWWKYVPDACWHAPEGPGSGAADDHPVTHVAYEDAEAYAAWAGKALATEAEWERAARGGIERARYAWGDEETPGGRWMANTWQGEFPWQNLGLDGFERTSPVGSFPPNGFGLHDMIGNVWEWTCEPDGRRQGSRPCCAPQADGPIERRIIKGGSHLCAPNYCLRYRPAAKQAHPVDTSTTHIGFRCVRREID